MNTSIAAALLGAGVYIGGGVIAIILIVILLLWLFNRA